MEILWFLLWQVVMPAIVVFFLFRAFGFDWGNLNLLHPRTIIAFIVWVAIVDYLYGVFTPASFVRGFIMGSVVAIIIPLLHKKFPPKSSNKAS